MPRILGLCAAALLVVCLMPPASGEGARAPLRVLLTGDSVTAGFHGDYTWRYRLAKEFQRQAVPVDFVGSLSTPTLDPGYPRAQYADPRFDHDHFAISGWQLREMAARIGAEVETQQPDVIVLEAGVNDFRYHPDDPHVVRDTETALRTWVANGRAAKPDVRIVVSPVLAVDTARAATLNPRISEYDDDLADIAAELTTPESPITLATTNQGWNPTGTLSVDGLHPSPTGETFIAQRIAEALHRTGLLPATPRVFRTVAWTRTQQPVVKVVGTSATVSWSGQQISGARLRVHRVGHAASTSAGVYAGAKARVHVVRRATYEFRIQLVRHRLTGPWGPVTRVRIAAARAKPPAPARVTLTDRSVRWSASPRATSYVVKYRRAHQERWITRQTTTRRVIATGVAVAKVRSVNSRGHSAWRRGHTDARTA